MIRFIVTGYFAIGLYLWWIGGGWNAPTLYENLYTLAYIVSLWPFNTGLLSFLR